MPPNVVESESAAVLHPGGTCVVDVEVLVEVLVEVDVVVVVEWLWWWPLPDADGVDVHAARASAPIPNNAPATRKRRFVSEWRAESTGLMGTVPVAASSRRRGSARARRRLAGAGLLTFRARSKSP